MGNTISKRKFVFNEILTPWNFYYWPLIPRFQLIFRPWFFSIFCFLRLDIDSYSCFWKSLTSIFDPMRDLGPKCPPPPSPPPQKKNLNYWSVPQRYVFYRRVISIEKPSSAPFPIWTWVCDQLTATYEVHTLKNKNKRRSLREIFIIFSFISVYCSFVANLL